MTPSTEHPHAGALERAGVEVATELLEQEPVDLRDELEPELRSPRARKGLASGCPCGCGDTELIMRARAGDDTAVEELLLRYRNLARSKARSYFLVGADRDDVVQEAMIGVFKAIRDFDPSRGVSFRSFAEVCVNRQVISAVKAANRLKHAPLSGSMSLDKPQVDGRPLQDLLAGHGEDPASTLVSADEMHALQQHIDEVLTDLELQVLRHHMEGKTYEQIADMLQRHVKAVDNALQRIRRKVQGHVLARESA